MLDWEAEGKGGGLAFPGLADDLKFQAVDGAETLCPGRPRQEKKEPRHWRMAPANKKAGGSRPATG
jgi:hypothetical protein